MIKLTSAETGAIVAVNTDWIAYAVPAPAGQNAETILTIGVPRLSDGRPHTISVREPFNRVVEMMSSGLLEGMKMASKHYRTTFLVLSFMLFAVHGSAQSPPTATEAFNLRIKCKKMSDDKAEELRWHPLSVADGASVGMSPTGVAAQNDRTKPEVVASWDSSKYDPINNRCYGRIYSHTSFLGWDNEYDSVYDLQTDDLLANAFIQKGKKTGAIWDPDYKKPFGPTCVGGCPANFGDQTWQAAEDYMNEIMADPRKQ